MTEHSWKDHVIDIAGELNPDESGEEDVVGFGFACPKCGNLCPHISESGIAGCLACKAIWERRKGKLVERDPDDF